MSLKDVARLAAKASSIPKAIREMSGVPDAIMVTMDRYASALAGLSMDDCPHDEIVPIDEDWARCTKCGDSSFPISDSAAGVGFFVRCIHCQNHAVRKTRHCRECMRDDLNELSQRRVENGTKNRRLPQNERTEK